VVGCRKAARCAEQRVLKGMMVLPVRSLSIKNRMRLHSVHVGLVQYRCENSKRANGWGLDW